MENLVCRNKRDGFKLGYIFITVPLLTLLTVCGSALADNITMTFGDSTPPYAFADTQGGLEVDIVREALALRGHTLKPVFVPAARVQHQFKHGLVDAASKDTSGQLQAIGALYGDASMEYHDVLISLASRELEITQPADLDGLSVIAFQNAWKVYSDWLQAVKDKGFYEETPDQTVQVKALLSGRADVAVADRYIFNYLATEMAAQTTDALPTLKYTSFAPPLVVRPVFSNEQVRDDFNAGLRQLRSSGRYEKIFDEYLNQP